ncbi:MAG: ftsH [Akkermansiaceae bacterium]|nr:ftsH [Akkermansiaceae bacterium]
MSESPQSRPPQGPNSRGANEPPGFNWRLAILLLAALMILGLAILNVKGRAVEELSYAQFTRLLDQGLIKTDDDKSASEKKFPITVTAGESITDATISGYYTPLANDVKKDGLKAEPFQVLMSVADLRQIVGEDVTLERTTAPVTPENPGAETPAAPTAINQAQFRKAFALGEIDTKTSPLIIHTADGNLGTVTGARVINSEMKLGEPKEFVVKTNPALLGEDIRDLLTKKGYSVTYKENNQWARGFLTFLPVLLIVLLLFFLFRQQMKAAGRGAMSFGKSKARLLTRDHNKVTFKDVAGIQEAKEELWEIVDFLRDPRKFQKLGGSIPKGVLMVGPPGTGKTLLARAIAGEADVPFFSISGSDFVEMFVGVGASRVRDMFEQGKKHAPCLIFIDEIDAVGRHRGHGMGGGHDEREQTLNQLLVEMDGFDTQEGVIIIAATNRPDVLDPALLRPGRFDRQVNVSLPDVNGREEILRVHVKKIKLAPSTDLARIARGTPGFSGAELANLINEAALLAARRGLSSVTIAELEEARDKVRWGRERRSLAMSDRERIGTAWHEAGHAYLNLVLPHTDPLHKVTIIPRGPFLGATMFLPDGDKYSTQRKEALADLIVTMGGRIAESFHSDDVSNGASGDIRGATSLARHMVCEWGMSDKLGMIEYGEASGANSYMGRGPSRTYSEDTARLIDAEIKRFIDEAYQQAAEILTANRQTVEIIAMALLEYETLDAEHVRDLIDHGKMKNPPTPGAKPPALPNDTRKPVPKKPVEEVEDGEGPLPGAIVGAPA